MELVDCHFLELNLEAGKNKSAFRAASASIIYIKPSICSSERKWGDQASWEQAIGFLLKNVSSTGTTGLGS